MNYLQRKKLAFMSIVNSVKGFVRTVLGVPPLTLPDCVDNNSLINYNIQGNSVQDGTPTPETPVGVESVGEYDEETGKYKIPIICSDGKGKSVTTNIFLDEPLRKVGSYRDYIDFENQKIIRQVYCEKLNSTNLKRMAQGTTSRFYKPVSKSILSSYRGGLGNCFKISATKYNDSLSNNEAMLSPSAKNIYIRCDDLTLDEYKQLLDSEDVLIYYVMAETEETPITLPKLPTFKGTTIISVETEVKPSNMEVTYYSTSKE